MMALWTMSIAITSPSPSARFRRMHSVAEANCHPAVIPSLDNDLPSRSQRNRCDPASVAARAQSRRTHADPAAVTHRHSKHRDDAMKIPARQSTLPAGIVGRGRPAQRRAVFMGLECRLTLKQEGDTPKRQVTLETAGDSSMSSHQSRSWKVSQTQPILNSYRHARASGWGQRSQR